jgi:U3 small nucleolar RNA-associated protein 18
MFDAVGSHALVQIPTEGQFSDEENAAGDARGPAWQDSDDDRLAVSLASNNRLRKLRRTEEEDVINGREYTRRLRQQYLKLHPTPTWAKEASDQPHRSKRRKANNGDDSSTDDSESGSSDTESSTAQPLAELLRSGVQLVQSSSKRKRKLRPETINIQRSKHITSSGPSAITSLQIHPSLPLLLASGPSSRMDLYHLHNQPPDYSSAMTSLVLKHTPLSTTAFHPNAADARVFLAARRRYFHVWDLATGTVQKVTRMYGHTSEQKSMETFRISPDGNHVAFLGTSRKAGGVVNILNLTTLQWAAQARVDSHGGIADLAWWQDGSGVCILGKSGLVTEWSLSERRAVASWKDQGGVNCTIIALGGRSGRAEVGGDAWVAIGSSSGIVNVYSRRAWFTSPSPGSEGNAGVPTSPEPVRALDHLTTPTSHLAFSADGQVLVMASRWKKDALRLVHLPTCTVYQNWPTSATPLGRISAVAWGTGDANDGEVARLVVANEKGRIMSWCIRE